MMVKVVPLDQSEVMILFPSRQSIRSEKELSEVEPIDSDIELLMELASVSIHLSSMLRQQMSQVPLQPLD